MHTRVILHNSVSVDGAFRGFEVDMGEHYRVVGRFAADVYLVGSATALAGIGIYNPEIPAEEESDFRKPDRPEGLSWWVIPDSTGRLQGLLHIFRRFEYCRDVIIFVSRSTPAGYLRYLEERGYYYIVAGEVKTDLREAFGILRARYDVRTILADTGTTLGNVLLREELVDELSLLVHPLLAACGDDTLFAPLIDPGGLELISCETRPGGLVHLHYKLGPGNEAQPMT